MSLKKFTNVVEHAGTGLMIPEVMARQIDEISKPLPKDFAFRRFARLTDVEELSPGERCDVSVITTDGVDREGDVILPSGLNWSQFNKIVPFAHKYDQLPVGSCLWMKPTSDGRGLKAKTQYATKPPDWGDAAWMPSAILHLMQQTPPICTGKSIGFIPLNMRSATAAEKAMRPEWKDARIIDSGMGLEYSIAPIPAQPQAEMIAVSKMLSSGEIDKSLLEILGITEATEPAAALELPPVPEVTQPAAVPEIVLPDAGRLFVRSAILRGAILREIEAIRPWLAKETRRHIDEAMAELLGTA